MQTPFDVAFVAVAEACVHLKRGLITREEFVESIMANGLMMADLLEEQAVAEWNAPLDDDDQVQL